MIQGGAQNFKGNGYVIFFLSWIVDTLVFNVPIYTYILVCIYFMFNYKNFKSKYSFNEQIYIES